MNIIFCETFQFANSAHYPKDIRRGGGGMSLINMCRMGKNRIVPKITDGCLQDYRFLYPVDECRT